MEGLRIPYGRTRRRVDRQGDEIYGGCQSFGHERIHRF